MENLEQTRALLFFMNQNLTAQFVWAQFAHLVL